MKMSVKLSYKTSLKSEREERDLQCLKDCSKVAFLIKYEKIDTEKQVQQSVKRLPV